MISGKQVPPFCGFALISTHYNTSVHECIIPSFSPRESNAVQAALRERNGPFLSVCALN